MFKFLALKVKIFLKNGILGGVFYKKFYWGIVYLKLTGHKKSLAGRKWPAGRTLAMPGIYTFRTGNGLKGGKGQMRIQSELSYWRHSEF